MIKLWKSHTAYYIDHLHFKILKQVKINTLTENKIATTGWMDDADFEQGTVRVIPLVDYKYADNKALGVKKQQMAANCYLLTKWY